MLAFTFYKQYDSADCGPACLKMIARHYGKDYNIEFLRDRSYITKDGVSLLGLSHAAEQIGLQTQGVQISFEQLQKDVPLPCIVHWRNKHFMVVYQIQKRGWWSFTKKETILVADPAHGRLRYNADEFNEGWKGSSRNGVALLLEPTENFYSEDRKQDKNRRIALLQLFKYLRPYSRYIVQLFIGLLLGTLVGLLFPFLTQAIVDYGIANSDLAFVTLILVAQIILNFSQTLNALIQSWITLHITSRVSIKMTSGFLAKMMRLPISFFYSRTIGDVLQRINDQNRIQSFITASFVSMLFGIITLISYSVILLYYNTTVLFIFYCGSILYFGWIAFFLRYRKDLDYKRFQESANNQNNLVQLMAGMQEIRLSGSETQKRWEWERIQARLFRINLRGLTLNQNQTLGSAFIDQTKNIIISFLAARAVIHGEITLGAMMSVQYIIGQLNAPVHQFIGFIQSAQDAKISLDRLDEIYNKRDEEVASDNKLYSIPPNADIKIANVSFQYEGPGSPKVLHNLNLTIPYGKVTAIVGESGSGKTTLLKVLMGIYQPTEGEIFLGRISLSKFSPSAWRHSCGVVLQDGFIFKDTIANNIALGDEHPDFTRLDTAVAAANIKEMIAAIPLGYSTMIGADGHGLSSGQRQRLLMARAIYKDASYIFLDEATNSLDAKNEKVIVENLTTLCANKTVIVIAHRLSTIRHADQIVVLDSGKIQEVGTHEQLLASKGQYFQLVKHQL
jgi:ATP-binding cassette, subfamily B, bacterial